MGGTDQAGGLRAIFDAQLYGYAKDALSRIAVCVPMPTRHAGIVIWNSRVLPGLHDVEFTRTPARRLYIKET
jgi:hypothetical protein